MLLKLQRHIVLGTKSGDFAQRGIKLIEDVIRQLATDELNNRNHQLLTDDLNYYF
jgi:hypothetical protein